MQIRLNGEVLETAAVLTVQGLIAGQQLAGQRLAVELNGDVVPRSRWGEVALKDGDQVELVRAIGGG
jgi:sulfur carrier protein